MQKVPIQLKNFELDYWEALQKECSPQCTSRNTKSIQSSAVVIHRILFRSTFWPNTSDQNILPKYIRPFWLVSVTNRIFRYFISLRECSVHEGNITVFGG